MNHAALRRWPLAWGVLSCILIAPSALGAAPPPLTLPATPARETLHYGATEVLVARTAKATPEDLQVPFYKGATVREGYTRRLTKKEDGIQLSYLATALLDTRDHPEVVAKWYSAQLPGKPKAERLVDKQGARWVLAVGSKDEVRLVTITQTPRGSAIKLTRTIKHTETLPVPGDEETPKPESPPAPPMHVPPGGARA